ncbi:MAG: hypothetical protein QOF61_2227 [Acidobacteriota bacterium]|nr:hypothetical protein [Acidobacteriota bacterium]
MSTERGRRAKERKRSRIVVDIEDLRRAGRGERDRTARVPRRRRRLSKGGRRKIALGAIIVGVMLVAALVGVGVWYQSYKKTPAYSLALLVDAAARGDRQAVDQLVDIDQVTQSLVPQVVAKISERAQTPAQPNGQTQVPASVRRYVEANAGVLIPGAREAVRDALIQGIKQGVASHADSYPFFVTALGARFAADEIKEDGDLGQVAFKSNAQPVVLTLQRSGGGERWRVVSVQSDELASRIADNLSRGLPALGR